ncbi:MAG: ATP-binding cassette domain-containing protein [Eubacterium sp.]|nr:ATP-binding cassette domain-containing protein [Eubacterium sp.]
MPLLQLNAIFKNYIQGGNDVPVLKNINLTIEEGEYVAIMGPSGSGKSTLMNIIGCLDKPTDGKYYLADQDIGSLSDRKLSDIRNKEIGFVFQNFNLMPRQSALQNVELPLQYAHIPRRSRRPLCEEALIKVGLEDRMQFKAIQLSGGQKQRVAIARAIVNKPRILLADEPTGALDSKSGIQVMELFKQLHNEGSTIIMITHAQEIAEHANRIIKIFDGEITSDRINDNPTPAGVVYVSASQAVSAGDSSENAPQSPMTQSPVAQSPVAQSPVAQGPVVQSPVAQNSEPAPQRLVASQTTSDIELSDAGNEETVKQPIQGPAVNQQPVKGPVVNQQPVKGPVVNQQPVKGPAVNQQPVKGPAVNQQPVKGPVVNQQPVKGPVVNQQPVKDAVVLDKQAAKGPVAPTEGGAE